MRRGVTWWRVAAATALALVVGVIGGPGPSTGADLTSDGATCSAAVNVSDGDRVYSVDARDGEARVPRSGTVNWRASTEEPVHQVAGRVALRVAFWDVPLARWGPSANEAGQLVATGRKDVPAFFGVLPRGKYRIAGSMGSGQGRCRGSVLVLVGKGAFDSVVGAIAVAGTPLYALAVVLMLRMPRAPGRGALAVFLGLFLGVMVAVDLLVANLAASDSPLVVLIPVAVPITTLLVARRRRLNA